MKEATVDKRLGLMIKAYQAGRTLEEIGVSANISRQRVHQLLVGKVTMRRRGRRG